MHQGIGDALILRLDDVRHRANGKRRTPVSEVAESCVNKHEGAANWRRTNTLHGYKLGSTVSHHSDGIEGIGIRQ